MMRYDDDIKARAIREFINTNSYAPTPDELRDAISVLRETYATAEQVGFSGIDVYKPHYAEVASLALENQTRTALMEDLDGLLQDGLSLHTRLENGHRRFMGSLARLSKAIACLEARVDNLLVSKVDPDQLVYGIQETFDDHTYVDLASSSVSVESGWVTLQRNGYDVIDHSEVQINTSIVAEHGYLGLQQLGQIQNMNQPDGTYWETHILTSNRIGTVALVIDITLSSAQYIGEVRLMSRTPNMNSQTDITVEYSVDGQSYSVVGAPLVALRNGEHTSLVGRETVKKLRITLRKAKADELVTNQTNQYKYIYALDAIQIYNNRFSDTGYGELVMGPYSVVDENNAEINWSKAKLTCCGEFPEGTSLEFYIQQNAGWVWAGTHLDNPVVILHGDDISGTYAVIDSNVLEGTLVDPGTLPLQRGSESYINLYIPIANIALVAERTIRVLRNTVVPNLKVYGEDSGWVQIGNMMQTTIDTDEAREIDFGPTNVIFNGRDVSGKVTVPPGHHTWQVAQGNYQVIDQAPSTLNELRRYDSQYPYNPKYLIGGFTYPNGWQGEQVYRGLGNIYGYECTYIPPERFDGKNQNVYTIVKDTTGWYFKVAVDKRDSTWSAEQFSVLWQSTRGNSNDLSVKCILRSNRSNITPKLDSFRIRVV